MQITLCRYTREDLARAKYELLTILALANAPDAPLNPGPHCGYCRALSICPAVHREVETLSALTINASGLTVSDEDIAALRAKTGAAKKMCAAIEAEAFRRASENPEKWEAMGWQIKEGAGRRSVENVAEVSERLHEKGASWQDITAACSITIGDVESLTRKATGLKGGALKIESAHILSGCVTIKKAKPSLKRIGTEEDEE